MRTSVIIMTALLVVGGTASPAVAGKPVPIPTPEPAVLEGFCGGSITLNVIKNNVKSSFEADESGNFTDRLRGNFVLEVTADDGRSAVIRTPGQLRVTGTGDSVTISSIGRTLIVLPPSDIPELKAERDALLAAGLPDLALITGRVDTALTIDPATGIPTHAETTYTGKVVDVCDLLE